MFNEFKKTNTLKTLTLDIKKPIKSTLKPGIRHKSCPYFQVDLISGDDRRWKLAHPEIPQRTGKINNVNKFDASFFGVHYKQAHTMDPMCRILLEKAYEAVIDAGK